MLALDPGTGATRPVPAPWSPIPYPAPKGGLMSCDLRTSAFYYIAGDELRAVEEGITRTVARVTGPILMEVVEEAGVVVVGNAYGRVTAYDTATGAVVGEFSLGRTVRGTIMTDVEGVDDAVLAELERNGAVL